LSTVQAQAPTTTPSKEGDAALRQKAFDLLDSVAGQISILQSPENRARLSANIAEAIWDHDEKRARALFTAVQEDVNQGMRIQEGDPESDRQRHMVFLQLRVNTVQRIARHDPELALAFFKNTASPPPETTGDNPAPEYRFSEEQSLALGLAAQVADKNPEVALSLARDSLAKDFSYDLVPLLRQLNRKHPDHAQTLFGEIVDKLKHLNLATDQNAFYFASNLARAFAPPSDNIESFRELVNLLISAADANGCNRKLSEDDEHRYFCYEVGRLLPLFDKVSRGRSASLKQWQPEEPEDQSADPAADSISDELKDISENGSIDEILALATKYPQARDTIYEVAFTKAEMAGDVDRARKIAAEAPAGLTRSSFLEMLDKQEQALAKFRESLKDVDKTLDSLAGMDQKIYFILGAAGSIAQTDRKEAVKLLDRARGLLSNMKPGMEQLDLQMVVAMAYSIYSSNRGIVMIESSMPKLNELVGAAAKLDGYETHHLRDGEWNMSSEGPLGALFTILAQSASYFAWSDFDRAVSVAEQFERPELRLMAQVKLAQGILAGRPKPNTNTFAPLRFEY